MEVEGVRCPKCNHLQVCPCDSCIGRRQGVKPWIWAEDGNSIICAGCGLTKSADWWEDEEAIQRKV